jgi:hypothetical protein
MLKRQLAAAAAVLVIQAASLTAADAAVPSAAPPAAIRADFGSHNASQQVQQLADWAVRTGDHRALPFTLIDKVNAQLYAFDARGRLLGVTPVLIGMGIGDSFARGVRQMDMYQTKPWQRVTPAGRFEAEVFEKGHGESTIWVDYDAGIALHKMLTRSSSERRAERMASARASDHRITYGCINVPAAFYDTVLYPTFKPRDGIVYVLPENNALEAVFDIGSEEMMEAIRVAAEPRRELERRPDLHDRSPDPYAR